MLNQQDRQRLPLLCLKHSASGATPLKSKTKIGYPRFILDTEHGNEKSEPQNIEY